MAVQLKAERLKAIGIEPSGDGPAEGQASPAAPKDAKQTGFMLALMDAAEDEGLELPPEFSSSEEDEEEYEPPPGWAAVGPTVMRAYGWCINMAWCSAY